VAGLPRRELRLLGSLVLLVLDLVLPLEPSLGGVLQQIVRTLPKF